MTATARIVDLRRFALAGRAVFTVVSGKTGTRYTYKVLSEEGKPSWVYVLTGPELWMFAGTIFEGRRFAASDKGVGREAPSNKAFGWVWSHPDSAAMEVWHEGACARCGRPLTDPASIEAGFGPTCRQK